MNLRRLLRGFGSSGEPAVVKPEPEIAGPATEPEPIEHRPEQVPEQAPEPAEPAGEISPVRLDQALQRLRDENPASSDEEPSDPSA